MMGAEFQHHASSAVDQFPSNLEKPKTDTLYLQAFGLFGERQRTHKIVDVVGKHADHHANGILQEMRTVGLVEEETIFRFLDEVLHGTSLPIRLVDAFSRGSIGQIGDDEFVVENQFIRFPDGTYANPTVMLPSAGLIADRVKMFFPLTPFGLIPNLNKLFRHLE